MLNLEEASDQLVISDFTEVERSAQGRLPNLFKQIYLHNNGGYPARTEIESDEYVLSINGFNSIRYGRPSVEVLMRDLYSTYNFMVGLIPFAYDDGGNSYMLSVRTQDAGSVYLWLQDEERLEIVFTSFERFVSAFN